MNAPSRNAARRATCSLILSRSRNRPAKVGAGLHDLHDLNGKESQTIGQYRSEMPDEITIKFDRVISLSFTEIDRIDFCGRYARVGTRCRLFCGSLYRGKVHGVAAHCISAIINTSRVSLLGKRQHMSIIDNFPMPLLIKPP